MKTKRIIVAVAFLIASFTGGCTPAAVTESKCALGLANEAYLADIKSYRLETAALIATNDSLLAGFKANLEREGKETNPYYKRQVVDLEQKTKEMKEKLAGYSEQQPGGWAEFKEEFSQEMHDLGEAFRDLSVKNTK